jgi:hypothetical protein
VNSKLIQVQAQHKCKESAMSEFTVYSVPGSPFGRAALATLEEKGAAYRFSSVIPGTMRAPEHLSRHPFGRVPVLQHDGFSLYEARPFCAISTGCCRTRR